MAPEAILANFLLVLACRTGVNRETGMLFCDRIDHAGIVLTVWSPWEGIYDERGSRIWDACLGGALRLVVPTTPHNRTPKRQDDRRSPQHELSSFAQGTQQY
jgi:hypothetical protein